MKTIKLIDLLNKIANGEEIPKKIKYQNYEYEFNQVDKEYQRWFNGLSYGLGEDRRLDIILDDEAEILEDNDKLEKIKWEEKESLAKPLMINDKVEVLARRTEKLKKKIADLIEHINKIEEKLDERI